jgi:hypothetical protein
MARKSHPRIELMILIGQDLPDSERSDGDKLQRLGLFCPSRIPFFEVSA